MSCPLSVLYGTRFSVFRISGILLILNVFNFNHFVVLRIFHITWFLSNAKLGEAPPVPTFRWGVDCILSPLGGSAPLWRTDTRAVVEGVPYLCSVRSRRDVGTLPADCPFRFAAKLILHVLTVPRAVNSAICAFPRRLGSGGFRGSPIIVRCLAGFRA